MTRQLSKVLVPLPEPNPILERTAHSVGFSKVTLDLRGWVMTGKVGIYTRRHPDRVRGANVVFLSKERWPDHPPRGFLEVAPDLVVEIMSPNDRWQDVRQKLAEYFAIGVRWVWIVEPENQTVLVFRPSLRCNNTARTTCWSVKVSSKASH